MRIPRLYLPIPLTSNTTVELDENALRHSVQVLRLKPDAPLILFNGEGGEYAATLISVTRHSAQAKVENFIDKDCESPLNIHLALGIIKGDRMDYALQKAVELGVSEITPLITERCVVQLDEKRTAKRMEHWQGIIHGACEQCGRNRLPKLHSPLQLTHHLDQASTGAKFILDPMAQVSLSSLEKSDNDLCLLIGPEGGFSEQERKQAIQANYKGISLGPRILRTETAVLAGITALQTLWGDIGN